MIDDHPDLQRRYRSPRAFGPMPGPRNIPSSQRDVEGLPDEISTNLSVSLEADPAELTRLLPPGLQLSGPAVLTVSVARFENLLWLAGRGYPILTVTFPVEYRGEPADSAVQGRYLAVLWEGLADPVTTGRDELGFPKLPADIQAPRIADVSATGTVAASASWEGFEFFDLTAEGLQAEPVGQAVPPKGTIVHRYVPSIVDPDRADIDQLIYHPIAGSTPRTVTDRLSGTGRFSFHEARFVDSPLQYPVVNTLAALSLSPTGPATFVRMTSAPGTTPGASAPRLLGDTVEQHRDLVAVGAGR